MQQANRSADSHEIRPLTGIRGFAASMVVLLHFYDSWVILLPSLSFCLAFAARGHLGVDLFFLLSGFILSYVYSAGDARLGFGDYRRFVWFRIARIYPNHVAMLVCLALLVMTARRLGVTLSGDYPLSGLPFQLSMTHAWPFSHGGAWNYPSWTISAEWFAYLCIFPISWRLLRLDVGEVASLILCFALLALWLFVLSPKANPAFHRLLQVSCEFIAGALLFGVYRKAGRFTRSCQQHGAMLFVILLGVLLFWPTSSPLAVPLITLLFPALLLGLTSETSFLSTLFSSSFPLWLGRVSYALYMSHGVVRKLLKIVLPSERYIASPLPVRLLLLFVNAGLILLFAAALYYVVEIPARNCMRRIYQRWANRAEN